MLALVVVIQGHHHTGDRAARRPYMTCSICGHRFATHRFGVRGGREWAHSAARPLVPISSPLTLHMVYLLKFLSYLAGPKSVSARSPRI